MKIKTVIKKKNPIKGELVFDKEFLKLKTLIFTNL